MNLVKEKREYIVGRRGRGRGKGFEGKDHQLETGNSEKVNLLTGKLCCAVFCLGPPKLRGSFQDKSQSQRRKKEKKIFEF